MDKNDYYHSFKTRLENLPDQGSSHILRGSTRQVDTSFITRVIIIILISTLNIN